MFRTARLAATTVVVCLLVLNVPAAAGSASSPPTYAPPVDAPISDPFRPPTTPYGPGNRGIEYATPPGATVVASADGTVRFAGVVAGKRWVTLNHADDVRTTYGPLAEFGVSMGDRERGQ